MKRPPFLEVPKSILPRLGELTGGELAVYLAILAWADRNRCLSWRGGACRKGFELDLGAVGRMTRLSDRQIRRAVSRLVTVGSIAVENRRGRRLIVVVAWRTPDIDVLPPRSGMSGVEPNPGHLCPGLPPSPPPEDPNPGQECPGTPVRNVRGSRASSYTRVIETSSETRRTPPTPPSRARGELKEIAEAAIAPIRGRGPPEAPSGGSLALLGPDPSPKPAGKEPGRRFGFMTLDEEDLEHLPKAPAPWTGSPEDQLKELADLAQVAIREAPWWHGPRPTAEALARAVGRIPAQLAATQPARLARIVVEAVRGAVEGVRPGSQPPRAIRAPSILAAVEAALAEEVAHPPRWPTVRTPEPPQDPQPRPLRALAGGDGKKPVDLDEDRE